MNCAYLILFDAQGVPDDLQAAQLAMLQAAGMHPQAAVGAARIFASEHTPVLCLPGGGVVIGELYNDKGRRVRTTEQLAGVHRCGDIVRYLLDAFWGDYIIVHPVAETPGAFSITRSPSHACALECVYSLPDRRGFATSDISLAGHLQPSDRRVDYDHVATRLVYPELKTRSTGLADVNELLPGSTLHVADDRASVVQSWDPWSFVRSDQRIRDPQAAALEVRRAVMKVVRAWAENDRSVLLELSGGLDSSIVGAALGRVNGLVTCATLTSSAPGADERDYACLVAQMLGAELSTIQMEYDDARFEFPLPLQSIVPVMGPLQYVVDALMKEGAERCGATSFFSGAGGDTVFCYLPNAAPAADAFRAAGLPTGFQSIKDLATFHQCTLWKAGRLTARQLTRPQGVTVEEDRALLSERLASPEISSLPWMDAPPGALPGDRLRVFGLSTALFFQHSCPRGLTRPLRMPLLAQPVIEACLRVPSWMWFSGGRNRSVARDAFADLLPTKVLLRKSKGSLSAYMGAVYRRQGARMIDFLADGDLSARGLLDADALRAYGRQPPAQLGLEFMRIFRLCAIENWVRKQSAFGVSS